MVENTITLGAFVAQMILIFFLSRISIKEIFYFLKEFIKSDRLSFSIIAVIYLPGTIVHETSHLLLAILLMLKVRNVRFFPQIKDHNVQLGSVAIEKKDPFRSILVGIAPIFIGLSFFWLLSALKLFPTDNLTNNSIYIYLIFTISSSMFSSRKDLVDLLYVVPLGIIIGGIMYIFRLDLKAEFLQAINLYLFFSILINLLIILTLKSFRTIFFR